MRKDLQELPTSRIEKIETSGFLCEKHDEVALFKNTLINP